MKTMITIAITLALTFANNVFAIDYNKDKPINKDPQTNTFDFNYSKGNPYETNSYNHNPHHGHHHHGHSGCGGNYSKHPHYGNGYPGNHYPNHPGYGNPYPNYGGPAYPGSNYPNTNSFNGFIRALNNESFDNNKLKMAQHYASSVVLTVQQIGQILQELSFDSNRLKFAKRAYNNCYDKYNYVLLRNNFKFSSNFENLMDAVSY